MDELSPSAISHITDKVLGAAAEWQNRMLDLDEINSLYLYFNSSNFSFNLSILAFFLSS